IMICTAYRHRGALLQRYPSDSDLLEGVEPVYETLSGWQEDLTSARTFEALPAPAKKYIQTIEAMLGVPIKMISVGPSREQVVFK
ncbi:MAG: adenylosuccinate synthetase, partial [Deltaproteobacteria bacterium]